jgi:hypothetical protein
VGSDSPGFPAIARRENSDPQLSETIFLTFPSSYSRRLISDFVNSATSKLFSAPPAVVCEFNVMVTKVSC